MGLVFQRIGLVFQRIRLVFQTDYYLNPLRACPPSVRHSYGEIHSQQLLLLLQLLPRAVLVLLFWRLLLWLCFVTVAVFFCGCCGDSYAIISCARAFTHVLGCWFGVVSIEG
jgi:hypothetical protein